MRVITVIHRLNMTYYYERKTIVSISSSFDIKINKPKSQLQTRFQWVFFVWAKEKCTFFLKCHLYSLTADMPCNAS